MKKKKKCFYIDPGGQNSHPGGPGGDSGGEKHQKIDFFEKLICL